tara:strand:+ start:1499 stop:2665 length:1167 start_codon:yes stop_codon:yes gene_type:complete
MKKFNILFFSSGRSDYDLIKPIMNEFKKLNYFNSYLILTGSHLSKRHGRTFKNIDQKLVKKLFKIDINSNYINYDNFSLSFIQAQKKFEKFFKKKKFDLAIILGDRYEALAFGLCCFFKKIKIAHIHGGEITQGSIDDTFRHLLTKISNIHYVTNTEHQKRVIQLGEKPKSVVNVGLLGYENILKMNFLDKETLLKKLKIDQNKKNILVSYHPVTKLSKGENIYQFNQLLIALKKFSNFNIIFTSPNIDPGNKDIVDRIKKFLKKSKNSYFFYSLGQKYFFSLAKTSEIFIGNSSSGILEIPFLKVPVINIGIRQKKRYNFLKISHEQPNSKKIIKRIEMILSKKDSKILNIKRVNTSKKISLSIINFLKNTKYIDQKIFYDLEINTK